MSQCVSETKVQSLSMLSAPTYKPARHSSGRGAVSKTYMFRDSMIPTSVIRKRNALVFTPFRFPHESNADRFQRLAEEWYRNRPHGDIHRMCTHSSYLKIVAMGPVAIPLIIEELRKKPDHWFRALKLLTEAENVVPPEDRGDIDLMALAWIRWWDAKHKRFAV